MHPIITTAVAREMAADRRAVAAAARVVAPRSPSRSTALRRLAARRRGAAGILVAPGVRSR